MVLFFQGFGFFCDLHLGDRSRSRMEEAGKELHDFSIQSHEVYDVS